MIWFRLLSEPPNAPFTLVLASSVTEQVELVLPLQPPPLHPAKLNELVALAVRVTWVPLAKLALQLEGQLIPPGLLVIVPVPLPEVVTVSSEDAPLTKAAVTVTGLLTESWQLPAPLQPPPLQFEKV